MPHDTTEPDRLAAPFGALAIAALGWRVFPLRPGQKEPAVNDWPRVATADPAQIRLWADRFPDCNWGVLCGDGLSVVDLDGEKGVNGFKALDSTIFDAAKRTLRVRTPNNGFHVYFIGDLPNTQGRIAPKIDTRGCGKGYVVLPGSVLRDDCGELIGAYRALTDGPIIKAPAALLALLPPDLRTATALDPQTPLIEPDRSDAIATATAWLLGDAPLAVEGRGGDTTTFRVAAKLKDFGVSESTALSAMIDHWNARCEPPWPVDELAVKVGNAFAYGSNPPGSAHPAVLFAGVEPAPPSDEAATWPDPRPLPAELPPVSPFDPDLLPDVLRPWAVDIAERLGCPVEFVAIPAIVAVGSLVGRRVGIRPQSETPWVEVPNLWGMIVARPGALKSPALQAALAPLTRIEARATGHYRAAQALHELALDRFKAERNAREAAFRKQLAADPNAAVDFPEVSLPSPPTRRRYLVHDTTHEALGIILADNPAGVLVFRDELISLLKPLDREEFAVARGFYLQAWNGTASYSFDRITRDSVYIEACCLSIVGGVQPGRLAAYLAQAVRGGAGDDGFAQRFGLMVWPDAPGQWKEVDRAPDAQAQRAVEALFDRLDGLDPDAIGAQRDSDGPIPFLRLDPPARALFRDWRADLEELLRLGDLPPALESHFAKYRGLAPKLALIFHLIDVGHGPVGERAVERSIRWLRLLLKHAQRAYASVTAAPTTCARLILGKLRSGDLAPTFTAREVKQAHWSGLSSAEDVDTALAILVDLHWLAERTLSTGGRPRVEFTLNPKASEAFDGALGRASVARSKRREP
jgi:hypothetical protein